MTDATQPVPSMATTALMAVSAIFPVLSFGSVLLRWKARSMAKNRWQADDWWIMGTWVITLGVSINAWVFASLMGIDYYKVNPMLGSMRAAQCLFAGTLFLQPSLAAVKISILLFYKRVFPIQPFVYACWAAIAAVSLWCIVFEILVIFQGNPVSASWTGLGKFNFDIVAFGLSQAGTSLALDVIILTFPLPMLWNLHLQKRRKVAVGMIFWLGGFCCVAAIVRLVLLHDVLSRTVSTADEGYNLLYIQSKAYIFTIVEPNCSIIAACLPCYGTLVRSWGGRAPESLIRSVRSVLSLASRQNSNGSGASQKRNTEHTSSSQKLQSDSYIELTEVERSDRDLDEPRGWEDHNGKGHSDAIVEHGSNSGPATDTGIGVTRAFGSK